MRLHATTIAIDGYGVMIVGPSGSGKSDLALRLVDRGAILIADDQTVLGKAGDRISARAVAGFEGKIELRGVGIVTLPHQKEATVKLIVRLSTLVPRVPDPRVETHLGIDVPVMKFDAMRPSTPLLVEIALRQVVEGTR
ncbi:MAG: HPr kinase/phosphatase C-terminal domain-containing protein [Pacificimonas sp.]